MTTVRTIRFPDYDSFEKENGQVDGLEYATHRCFKDGKLVVEMTYYFNFVDSIPRKWPARITLKDFTDTLEEEVTTE